MAKQSHAQAVTRRGNRRLALADELAPQAAKQASLNDPTALAALVHPGGPPTVASAMKGLQRTLGNQATGAMVNRSLIQAWKDYTGKLFFTGARPNKALNEKEKGWNEAMLTWTDYQDSKKNTVYGPPGHETYAEMIAATTVAPPARVAPTLPGIAVPANDYKSMFLVDPAELYYSQDSISDTFTNGSSVVEFAADLAKGNIDTTKVPAIRLAVMDRAGGQIAVTIDNRRLWAFKKAGVQIRCRWCSPEEQQTNEFKFTARNSAAKGITMRKG